jgi:hypothetical protein
VRFLLGLLVVIPAVLLVVGQVRGRAKVRACCPADPRLDRRMAGAFDEVDPRPSR